MGKKFRLSDDSLNCYGFRIMTAGIDTRQFENNPIMLWMHERSQAFNDNLLPIGKWINLKKENNSLTAEPEIDMDDEFAKKIASKVDKGIINMCSVYVEPIELSDDPIFLIQGQTRPTVTKCKLIECSLVDIGGNDNSIRLLDRNGKEIKLTAGQDNELLPLLKKEPKTEKETKFFNNMKKVFVKLGLAENATEDQVIEKISGLENENIQLKAKVQTLETSINADKKARAEKLVNDAIAGRKFTADKKDKFVGMAMTDYDSAKEIIDAMQPVKLAGEIISPENPDSATGKEMTFDKLVAKGEAEVEKLKKEDFKEYCRLYKGKYGIDPSK